MQENNNKTINEKELEILEFWEKNKIFEKSLIENGNGKIEKNNYSFYDGPPFATGLPHFGHLLQSYLKDSIPRYQTMKGKYVRRVWGWDSHGLPIENLIEKELGFKSKAEIEAYGIGNFTKAATDSVLRFESDWKKIIPRLGRWVDMENRYITLSNTYTESCWWAFGELYKKGLVYEGYKVMHICPRCETPLAASEVALGYADVKDISVYVKFELEQSIDEEKNGKTYLLAWTTTPWTLPGNTAIAINKEIDYVKILYTGPTGVEKLILAKDLVEKVLATPPNPSSKEESNSAHVQFEIVEEFKGEKLIGKKYKPIFDYYNNPESLENLKSKNNPAVKMENIWKVWHADFVTANTGTGIAHEAPAFGEDDYHLAIANNIPLILHIAMDGKFLPAVKDFDGLRVKWKGETQATDKKIVEFLQTKTNNFFAQEIITHSYPLCWRCETPLLNFATNSWFVAVSKMREKLVEENKKVYWVPENVRDGRMGQWLEGARDWALSRNRYWGAPIPVWKCSVPTLDKGGLGGVDVFIPTSLKDLQTRTKSINNYFLIRHGETDANKKNLDVTENAIASGVIDCILGEDFSLNQEGVKQAIKAGETFKENHKDISLESIVIISSPYKRTLETAKIIAKSLGINENQIQIDKSVEEWQVGKENNGKTWDQFYQENKGVNYLYKLMQGATETKIDVQNRMAKFITSLEDKYVNETEKKNIIIVSHKSPIACIISRNNGELFESGTGNLPAWHNSKNCEIVNLDWHPLPIDEKGAVNFHLPFVDNLKVYDNNGNLMKREGGVFDCWFESGSMPYAQFHYPFENKELFAQNYPAEFIAEAQDQTRGWFYTMLVLGVGLFDKSPFRSVITSGMINAADGKKMSKSLKNYSDPMEVVEKYGSDALRYYVLSSPAVKGESMKFSDESVKQVYSKNISRLLNVLSFYKMYAPENAGGHWFVNAKSISDNVLDKYIVSRLKQVKHEVTTGFEELYVDAAFRPIEKFIDDLSVWYLRRSRDRFKSSNPDEVLQVMQTCKFVLQNFAKVLAPIMPFTAEMIWQEVKDKTQPDSVHLTGWGEVENMESQDFENIDKMEMVREMVSIILDERIKEKIKVRQPLASATFNSGKYISIFQDDNYLQEIREETNIREVTNKPGPHEVQDLPPTKLCTLDINLTPELKMEGTYRELVRLIQDKRKEANLKVSDLVDIILPNSLSPLEKDVVEKMGEELKKETGLKNISFGEEFKILV